ncbi:hypothetical protein SAMN05428939_2511 [Streptomyces sp. TLI_105]|nr:hypothetical protein SAMN05428939_2511 [Streptomyces sp. TLI_105]
MDGLLHTPGVDISDEGLTLDRQWIELGNNVCGVLRGCRDASAVAARFVGAGWSSRSSSWHGYELETSWCQMEIDPIDGPDVLLSGVVDPARLGDLGRLLGCFGLPYELELSDENNALVREIRG